MKKWGLPLKDFKGSFPKVDIGENKKGEKIKKGIDKSEKIVYNKGYPQTDANGSRRMSTRRSTQEAEEAPLLRV